MVLLGSPAGLASGAAPGGAAAAPGAHRARAGDAAAGYYQLVQYPQAGFGGYYQLVQYPQAGFGGYYAQIAAARRSIDIEIYELDDPLAERDLVASAARGVRVRVLLDSAYHGREVNSHAYAYLAAHGVLVRWAPSRYIFHIKASVFDGQTADVSTANLTSEYYDDTRDAELIDTDRVQVDAIAATFNHDWAAAPGGDPRDHTVQAPGLIWSPDTDGTSAEHTIVRLIAAAHSSIDFESEELSDAAVYDALAADARRGVRCEVVMTDDSEWDTAFRVLAAAGCQVHVLPDAAGTLYIHEKAIISDLGTPRASLVLGSQNASWESLNEDRELSLLVTSAGGGSPAIVAAARAFAQDFAAGHATPARTNAR